MGCLRMGSLPICLMAMAMHCHMGRENWVSAEMEGRCPLSARANYCIFLHTPYSLYNMHLVVKSSMKKKNLSCRD